MSSGGRFPEPFRQEWIDEQQHKLDLLLKQFEIETNPDEKRKLKNQIASRKRLLTMGPEKTHKAKLKQDRTLGRV
jgi:hypothetical protein